MGLVSWRVENLHESSIFDDKLYSIASNLPFPWILLGYICHPNITNLHFFPSPKKCACRVFPALTFRRPPNGKRRKPSSVSRTKKGMSLRSLGEFGHLCKGGRVTWWAFWLFFQGGHGRGQGHPCGYRTPFFSPFFVNWMGKW